MSNFHTFKDEYDSAKRDQEQISTTAPKINKLVKKTTNPKRDPISVFDKTTLPVLKEQLEKLKIPELDVTVLGSKFSLKNLVIRYLMDFFIVIPIFLGKTVVQMCKLIYFSIQQRKYQEAVISFIVYGIDSLIPLSYIFLFICLTYVENDIFYNWVASCFILFCTFLLLVVYYSIISEEIVSYRQFLDDKHLDGLGLGLCLHFYEEKILKSSLKRSISRTSIHENLGKLKDFNEFTTELNEHLKELMIDDTFFYYSYFSDPPVKDIDSPLLIPDPTSVCFVKHRGDMLLFRISDSSAKVEEKKASFSLIHYIICIILIFFKIVLPYIYVFEQFDEEERGDFPLFSITLFYIHMMLVIFPLVNHEDLRRRTYILESLNKLIVLESEDKKTIEELEKKALEGAASPGTQSKIDTLQQMKLSNLGKLDSTGEIFTQMDMTCNVTLETWDSCRRIAVLMDQKRSEKYEFVYVFLGMYAFFISFVLLQVLFHVYIFFDRESALNQPLITLIFSIDFFILMGLFFQRIYYASNFNETFQKHKDTLEKMNYVLDNLHSMLDHYYHNTTEPKNMVYNMIWKRLKEKTLSISYELENDEEKIKKFLDNYLINLRKCIRRIIKQIDFDTQHYKHKFLGLFTSDFNTVMSNCCIILVPVLPSLFQKILNNTSTNTNSINKNK